MNLRETTFFTCILVCLLGASGAQACRPIGYKCKSTDFRQNLKTAKYIVVAQLDKFLPDGMGEFTVLINLRGPIQPGAKLIQYARPKTNINSSCGNGMELGADILFRGEVYETHGNYLKLDHYECYGRSGVGKMPSGERPNLYPVINYILNGEI